MKKSWSKALTIYNTLRLHAVHRHSLLLQMSHAGWSGRTRVSCTKTAVPIDMPFGEGWLMWVQRTSEPRITWGADISGDRGTFRGDMCRPIIALIPHANVYVQRTRRTKVSTRWRKATKLKLQQNTCCSRYTKHGWMTVMTVSNQLVQHHIRNTYHWRASDGRTFFTVGPNHRQQSTFCLKSTISNVWNNNVQQISTHYDEAK